MHAPLSRFFSFQLAFLLSNLARSTSSRSSSSLPRLTTTAGFASFIPQPTGSSSSSSRRSSRTSSQQLPLAVSSTSFDKYINRRVIIPFSSSSSKLIAMAASGESDAAGDAPPRKKRGRPPKSASSESEIETPAAAKKPAAATRKKATTTTTKMPKPAVAAVAAEKEGSPAAAKAPTTKKEAAPVAKRPTPQRASIPRALTPRVEDGPPPPPTNDGRRLIRLLSWNVAGLRGLMKKEAAVDAFRAILERERPDVLCLQETKLQENHVEEVSAALRALHLPRYEGNWHCSTAKKGYSGTSILISEDSGLKVGKGGVRCGIGQAEGDGEGRVMTIDLGSFTLVNVYTPNSGEGLKRLDFRVGTWDRAFEQHLKQLQQGGKHAVLCCGDLNVAHLDADFFNPGEPRMEKAAGTTPQERASFGQLMGAAGMIDTFRHYHPEATGCYSYWSMRAGNRPYNRGMRLDYFLASSNMLSQEGGPRVVDSFILDQDPEVSKLSDHAPVGVLLAL